VPLKEENANTHQLVGGVMGCHIYSKCVYGCWVCLPSYTVPPFLALQVWSNLEEQWRLSESLFSPGISFFKDLFVSASSSTHQHWL